MNASKLTKKIFNLIWQSLQMETKFLRLTNRQFPNHILENNQLDSYMIILMALTVI